MQNQQTKQKKQKQSSKLLFNSTGNNPPIFAQSVVCFLYLGEL